MKWVSGRFVAAALITLLRFAVAGAAGGPEIVYETAVPGHYLASGHEIAVDSEGNAYFIGKAYQDHVHLDVFIGKLDPDGTPLWTRSIVGSGHDYATDIALDDASDVYVTGWTDSEDFPLVNALDDNLTGFREAFLMKLSATDGTILWSTFLGGDYTDTGEGIALNAAGEVILVGTTGSTDFPTTADAYQGGPSAPLYIYTDVFLTKVSANGDSILYSTYFGGFEDDYPVGVALDGDGNILIAGNTNAADFPLVDPVQSDPEDLFVSKLSPDGTTLLFSTYLGASDTDRLNGMAADADGAVYLVGSTRSVDFPTTPGAFQEAFVGAINGCGSPPFDPLHNCEDAFVLKLATDGTGLVYGTFLAGEGVDDGSNIAVDRAGHALVAGYTASPDFPGSDETSASIFVCDLGPDGTDLAYTFTKVSGSANAGHGIAVDQAGFVYVAGAIHVPADFYVAKLDGPARLTTGVAGGYPIASVAALHDPRPNPFNPATVIGFTLPEAARARLAVFDAAGRRVATLANRDFAAGDAEVVWGGRDEGGRPVPSGVYFARLVAGGSSTTRKLVLIR